MSKKQSVPWYGIGLLGIFILSLALRFWGLERFNTLVFDEVYYAKFANNYLTNTPFFDGHPPLTKCIIAVGIWIGSHLPFGQDAVNGYTGSLRSTWSYRWINALSGSFLPLIVAGIAHRLSRRRSFALLAGFFTACDGIFLVESRYALINIYIVIFGLLGQWFLLLALDSSKRRTIFLILSGICFGASIASKWNGVMFLLGVYIMWLIAWIFQWLQPPSVIVRAEPSPYEMRQISQSESPTTQSFIVRLRHGVEGQIYGLMANQPVLTPLQNFTRLDIIQIISYLGILPIIVYCLAWIPHIRLDTRYNFLEVHRQIWLFHNRLGGNTPDVHPYCSPWYTWPLMVRPMAYFYQTTRNINDPVPVVGPPLPNGVGRFIYDVHAMGNPFLWWFAFAAILFLVSMLLGQFFAHLVKYKGFSLTQPPSVDTWIALYITINYAIHLLPWVRVSRCVFIYHYMTAVPFAFLAIAWFVDQCIRSYHKELRVVGVTISFAIAAAFVFWLPIYLGLPLSTEDYRPLRMWFNSWI